jgi:DNA-binding transcriptional MerR regulator
MNGLWRVGELARATGVTVRALHHYEEIGLLEPTARTEAGHRLYGETAVRRLYAILALRSLGLPLAEIGPALEGADLRAVLDRHTAAVQAEIADRRQLLDALAAARAELEREGRPSLDSVVRVIKETTMVERYYTSEQLETLAARRRELGDEGLAAAERDWAELIAAVEAERARGTAPADARVQELAARWRELVRAFSGCDPGVERAARRVHEEGASAWSLDPELLVYVDAALACGRGPRD